MMKQIREIREIRGQVVGGGRVRVFNLGPSRPNVMALLLSVFSGSHAQTRSLHVRRPCRWTSGRLIGSRRRGGECNLDCCRLLRDPLTGTLLPFQDPDTARDAAYRD